MQPLRAAISDASVTGDVLIGLGSGERNRMLQSVGRPRTNESSPVLTLREVWRRYNLSPDILVLDAEGAEARILGNEDLPSPKPSLVFFERVALRASEKYAIDRRLRAQGYEHLADLRNGDPRGARTSSPPANRLYGKRKGAAAEAAPLANP